MAATIPSFRDETVADANEMRTRLNQLVKRVNASAAQWKAVRLPSVRNGQEVALQSPGFNVAAVTLAGVTRTDGSDTMTAAPWVSWRIAPDGKLAVTVNGLSALPAQYAANLVLFEGDSTT